MKRYIKSSDEKPQRFTDLLQQLCPDVYRRLCACCNREEDLPYLVGTMWTHMKNQGKDKQGFTREDALVQILEWLGENGQWELADISQSMYNYLKKDV